MAPVDLLSVRAMAGALAPEASIFSSFFFIFRPFATCWQRPNHRTVPRESAGIDLAGGINLSLTTQVHAFIHEAPESDTEPAVG
jgi:hypothetical protein